MATAACGRQCTSSDTTKKTHKEHLRKCKDSRRRQAALLFLNNISLDGRPLYHLSNGNQQRDATEVGSRDTAGAFAAGHPPFSPSCYGTLPHVAPSLAGDAVTTVARIRRNSPVPLNLNMPTDPGSYAGCGDVFIEGADPTISSDTPLSPIVGPQTFNPSAKSPSVLQTQSVPGDRPTRQRLRNLSGSPGPARVAKKVHFVKSMRQYDTRGSRIMLICAKRSLCAVFSVLPYGESIHLSDPKLDTHRQRLSSGVGSDLFPGLEGLEVELGQYGKTVSYAQFLFPTNALVRPKTSGALEPGTTQTPLSRYRGSGQKNLTMPPRLNSTVGQDPSMEDLLDYDPYLLSDPQWPCGRHKRVLTFSSYVATVIEYVKPSDLKKDMNETFKEKFPYIKLTLSKIRSLKREMRSVGDECSLQPVTVAMSFVYFEKLVLQGRLNKQNRKLVSAACVLLAAKISSDLKKQEVRQLIDKLEERFRINRRELIPLEFPVLVALEMGLYLPDSKVMPHYRRLVQQG
ncbi:hypothetical protein DPEC_G00011420 [Dallia pectoralis]|uniref:Uncharacterized protein n=1 Tax=Dallia pectoralis TaxID=75939 RepID=A0ACC2HLC7_DALPE|nr:hypothetical protein DPEC_G00011420 [Dallia pectoralis]